MEKRASAGLAKVEAIKVGQRGGAQGLQVSVESMPVVKGSTLEGLEPAEALDGEGASRAG